MDSILLVVFLIFAGQVLGSLAGLAKKPGKRLLYASLAFAGSMMLCISFFQLIPESLGITSVYLVAAAFVCGVIVMRVVDRVLPHINPELLKKEKPSVERSVAMLVVGMALHNVPEGLAIGTSFALNPGLGISIALGIAAQDVPENIATIVPLYGLTKKKLKSFLITTATILFEVLGFVLGYFVLVESSMHVLGASLALAAGFMSYISVEELFPAAQIRQNLKLGVISIVLGALCVFLIIFLC